MASEYVSTIELDEKVKACLQRKRFVLPQQQRNVAQKGGRRCTTRATKRELQRTQASALAPGLVAPPRARA